ncbi:hypothetical protein FHS18_002814 [Paenibacillus phyllosphaerae]|uniref:Uncharacterized protein n=1 Tax=Paenibacillus phyllosphaerae TaxID=274593 RepID=A0A7W5AY54_9BACL|nr:hypothetical protein [Paenibacillus phyllosphaerae]MBB3110747.1 hypothetical protein [Paenibacillus phyllosphaerae]
MWGVLASFGAGLLFAGYELPRLLRAQRKKEAVIFLMFLAIGITLCVLHALAVPLPSPYQWLEVIYGPLAERIFAMLQ